MGKWNLFGSTGSLATIKTQINQYYYTTNVELIEHKTNKNEWYLFNKKLNRILKDTRVVKRKSRYRFEVYL